MDSIERTAAILENPEDDTPRLDLAKHHYEETGLFGWGELIRLQVDLSLNLHPAACQANPQEPVTALCRDGNALAARLGTGNGNSSAR